jgi:hypothetical protein
MAQHPLEPGGEGVPGPGELSQRTPVQHVRPGDGDRDALAAVRRVEPRVPGDMPLSVKPGGHVCLAIVPDKGHRDRLVQPMHEVRSFAPTPNHPTVRRYLDPIRCFPPKEDPAAFDLAATVEGLDRKDRKKT